MPSLPTRTEQSAGRPLDPKEIFEITAAREKKLSRLLMLYISTGLVFMLLPGTFLGVWNLLAISSHRAANSVSPAWIQAHGHAQVFGWIGTFILGIGFFSIPKLRRMDPFSLSAVWVTWILWTSGVLLRWLSGVCPWQWRPFLAISAVLELAAFLIFFRQVSGHRPPPPTATQSGTGKSGRKWEEWVFVVIAGSLGLMATLIMNLVAAIWIAVRGMSPEFPASFDQRFLVLETWGFLVVFVWGFSAKWLPIFLGLRPLRGKVLLAAAGLNFTGVILALAGRILPSVIFLFAGIVTAICALRLFEPALRLAKVKGVHSSFPVFVRLAYAWAAIAAGLGIWAALVPDAPGIWGASRHALTVGFLATMVFAIGQRVLPAFSGMRLLFSSRLMFLALFLLAIGCLVRVSSEILAYQGFARSAWSWLPFSAITEMAAVTIFAFNLFATFIGKSRSDPDYKRSY